MMEGENHLHSGVEDWWLRSCQREDGMVCAVCQNDTTLNNWAQRRGDKKESGILCDNCFAMQHIESEMPVTEDVASRQYPKLSLKSKQRDTPANSSDSSDEEIESKNGDADSVDSTAECSSSENLLGLPGGSGKSAKKFDLGKVSSVTVARDYKVTRSGNVFSGRTGKHKLGPGMHKRGSLLFGAAAAKTRRGKLLFPENPPKCLGGKGRRFLFFKVQPPKKLTNDNVTLVRVTEDLMYEGVNYHVGDVVSVIEESEKVPYYAQLDGFVTDIDGSQMARITWLVPTTNKWRLAGDYNFKPSGYIAANYQSDGCPMKYVAFVCHAPAGFFHERAERLRFLIQTEGKKQKGESDSHLLCASGEPTSSSLLEDEDSVKYCLDKEIEQSDSNNTQAETVEVDGNVNTLLEKDVEHIKANGQEDGYEGDVQRQEQNVGEENVEGEGNGESDGKLAIN